MSTFFHGTDRAVFVAHEGLCLTDNADVAANYGQNLLATIEIDIDSFVVEECDGIYYDESYCPADDKAFRAAAAARGVDILVYDDVDKTGRQHGCWRLVSERAVAVVAAAAVVTCDDIDED